MAASLSTLACENRVQCGDGLFYRRIAGARRAFLRRRVVAVAFAVCIGRGLIPSEMAAEGVSHETPLRRGWPPALPALAWRNLDDAGRSSPGQQASRAGRAALHTPRRGADATIPLPPSAPIRGHPPSGETERVGDALPRRAPEPYEVRVGHVTGHRYVERDVPEYFRDFRGPVRTFGPAQGVPCRSSGTASRTTAASPVTMTPLSAAH